MLATYGPILMDGLRTIQGECVLLVIALILALVYRAGRIVR